ncbi:MAG: TldD/PmbA family protein [Theionarchaea archaeon]|nr:TldD/PmbA family protein [Theionarchaea archaeon]
MDSLVYPTEGECETYHQRGTRTKVVIANHRITSISRKYVRGTGVRVFLDGHQGFAYTTDETCLREATDLAVRLARSSTEVKHLPVPGEYDKVEGLYDPGLMLDVESDAEMALSMLEGVAQEGGNAVYGSIEITEMHHELTTSYGIVGRFKETSCYAGIDVEADGCFGTETLYTRKSGPDFFNMGGRAADLAIASKNPQNIEGGKMPIILRPPAVSKLCEYALAPSLLADNVDSETSLFGEGIGKRVMPDVTILDDGTLPGKIGSRPFDGEGSPCRKTVVVEKGILTSFLHDATTAFTHCTESTGNAVRSSFSTPPTIYVSNLVLVPKYKTDELIEDTRKGIVVHDLMGSFSFDFTTGKFGFEAKNVFLIENGEIKYPTVDVTVAGTIDDVLSTIEPGNDVKQEGLLIVPSTRIIGSVFAP